MRAQVLVALTVSGLCLGKVATAQRIYRGDLQHFVATVSVEFTYPESGRTSSLEALQPTVYGLRPGYPEKPPRLEKAGEPARLRRGTFDLSMPQLDPSSCQLVLDHWGIVLTTLSSEGISAIAFWAIDGDTLDFATFADTAFDYPLTYGPSQTLPDSSLVICLEYRSADFGQAWGTFYFCQLRAGSHHFRVLHQEVYDIEYFGDYVDVKYWLERPDSNITLAAIVRQHYLRVDETEPVPKHTLVRCDTILVDLWALAQADSHSGGH